MAELKKFSLSVETVRLFCKDYQNFRRVFKELSISNARELLVTGVVEDADILKLVRDLVLNRDFARLQLLDEVFEHTTETYLNILNKVQNIKAQSPMGSNVLEHLRLTGPKTPEIELPFTTFMQLGFEADLSISAENFEYARQLSLPPKGMLGFSGIKYALRKILKLPRRAQSTVASTQKKDQLLLSRSIDNRLAEIISWSVLESVMCRKAHSLKESELLEIQSQTLSFPKTSQLCRNLQKIGSFEISPEVLLEACKSDVVTDAFACGVIHTIEEAEVLIANQKRQATNFSL